MKATIDKALLPFAGLFATLPLYSPNMATLAERLGIQGAAMGSFAVPLLATVLVCGVALAIRPKRGATTVVPHGAPAALSAVLYLGGFALLVFDALQSSGDATTWAKVAAGVIVGAGTVRLLLLWQQRFTGQGIRPSLLNLALNCGIGSACAFILANLDGIPFLVAFFALAALGSVAPLPQIRGNRETEGTAASDHGPFPQTEPNPQPRQQLENSVASEEELPSLRPGHGALDIVIRLGSIAGAPLGGLVMFGLIMSMRKFSLFGSYDIELVAGIAAAAAAALVCLVPSRRPFFSFGYQEFLPACALALMVCGSFPLDNPVQIAGAMLMYVVFALVGLFAIASLLAIVRTGEFRSSLVMGVTLASYALASAAGVILGQLLPDDWLGPIVLAASSLYFAGLIMTAILSLARSADVSTPPAKRASVGALLTERCDELTEQFSLSPRETEILVYLARGHNPTYISRELVLSLSTVRTHIRNLYRKMAISSQEELIALVDEPDAR